jgi:hypothetical protein
VNADDAVFAHRPLHDYGWGNAPTPLTPLCGGWGGVTPCNPALGSPQGSARHGGVTAALRDTGYLWLYKPATWSTYTRQDISRFGMDAMEYCGASMFYQGGLFQLFGRTWPGLKRSSWEGGRTFLESLLDNHFSSWIGDTLEVQQTALDFLPDSAPRVVDLYRDELIDTLLYCGSVNSQYKTSIVRELQLAHNRYCNDE